MKEQGKHMLLGRGAALMIIGRMGKWIASNRGFDPFAPQTESDCLSPHHL
jgi:hypothetical protein